jgi:hypothetical protein
MTARVVAPTVTGTAILRLTLLQEGISWFDDQDPSNAIEFTVQIGPAEPASWATTQPTVTSARTPES